jgi:hypothetical protein
MLSNKNLNEQCGFMLRLMNDSLYPEKDYYDYTELFKLRDKECTIWYDLAKNMDIIKKDHNIKYEVEWKEFNDEFDKLNKESILYKHFELTHSTYLGMYNKVNEHLKTSKDTSWKESIIEWIDYFKDTVTIRGMYNFLSTGEYNFQKTQDILYEKGDIPL